MSKLYRDYYTNNIYDESKLDKQIINGLYIDDGIRIGTDMRYISIYFRGNVVVLSGEGWYLCTIGDSGDEYSFYSVMDYGGSVSVEELPVEVREYVMVLRIK